MYVINFGLAPIGMLNNSSNLLDVNKTLIVSTPGNFFQEVFGLSQLMR